MDTFLYAGALVVAYIGVRWLTRDPVDVEDLMDSLLAGEPEPLEIPDLDELYPNDPRTDYGTERAHVWFNPVATVRVQIMARRRGITVHELVRRSIGLYEYASTLPRSDYLAVVRGNGDIDRIVL